MSETLSELIARPAFSQMTGIDAVRPGVHVRLLAPAMVSVLVRRGQTGALTEAARAHFQLELADGPVGGHMGGICFLGIGPGRWLFLGAPVERLLPLAATASLSEQGDGYAVFEISGPDARAALAKGVAVDLENFAADAVAVTPIAHIGAIVWKNGRGHFCIAVFRSYADSFWHWLTASAAEFGLKVEQEP